MHWEVVVSLVSGLVGLVVGGTGKYFLREMSDLRVRSAGIRYEHADQQGMLLQFSEEGGVYIRVEAHEVAQQEREYQPEQAFVRGIGYVYGNIGFGRKKQPTLERQLAEVYREIGSASLSVSMISDTKEAVEHGVIRLPAGVRVVEPYTGPR